MEASIYVSSHERCFANKNWTLDDIFDNLTCLRRILAIWYALELIPGAKDDR